MSLWLHRKIPTLKNTLLCHNIIEIARFLIWHPSCFWKVCLERRRRRRRRFTFFFGVVSSSPCSDISKNYQEIVIRRLQHSDFEFSYFEKMTPIFGVNYYQTTTKLLWEKLFSTTKRPALRMSVIMADHNSRCIAFGHFQKFTKTYKKFCIESI